MPPHVTDEWHEYDQLGQRVKAVFVVPNERFLIREHRDVRHVAMINAVTGILVLRKKRRRDFFAKLVPEARWYAARNRGLSGRLAHIPVWYETVRQQLLDKPHA